MLWNSGYQHFHLQNALNSGDQHFSFSHSVFYTSQKNFQYFGHIYIFLCKINALNSDYSKILLFGKELTRFIPLWRLSIVSNMVMLERWSQWLRRICMEDQQLEVQESMYRFTGCHDITTVVQSSIKHHTINQSTEFEINIWDGKNYKYS